MELNTRLLTVLAVVLVVASVIALPAAAQQSDTVTLTVSVETTSGATVGGAELTATWDGGSATATTASNGKAFVDVPAGARVELNASSSDYVRNFPLVVEEASESTVTLEVAQRASLSVTVVSDGSTVSDASVVLRQDGRIVAAGRTGDDGVYASGSIEEDAYSLSVVKEGYFFNTSTVVVEGNAQRRVVLNSGAVVYEFEVVDPHFDPPEPVPNATITIQGTGSFNTLASGEATARLPVNADLQMRVTKDGYGNASRQLSVNERDGDVTVRIERTPSLRLETTNERVVAGERVVVSVFNAYDEPAAGVTVLRNGESVGTTGDDGEAAVRLPEPGEYALSARDGDVNASAVTVTAVQVATESPTPTATPTTTPGGTTTDDASSGFGPGFGPLLALAALLAFVVAARRRGR